MYLNINAEQRKNVSVLVVKDLIQYTESMVMDLKQRGQLQFDGFDVYLWLLFSGNKGRKLMKFHFEVINSKDGGSVYNVHIYAMYEGSDCRKNMTLVLLIFFAYIETLQSEEFLLCGYKVKVFLGGDFKFLDDCLGHQGSAATYPSAKYSVQRDHLQNHPKGKAHTPENCPEITARTLKELEASYKKHLTDDRAGGDLHKTGKYHESVTGEVIFPLKSLSQVVTPLLHIRLGTVLKFYQILLTKTQEKDSTETKSARADQEEVWDSKSEQLLIKEEELVNSGTFDLENLMDRLKAVQSKD